MESSAADQVTGPLQINLVINITNCIFSIAEIHLLPVPSILLEAYS